MLFILQANGLLSVGGSSNQPMLDQTSDNSSNQQIGKEHAQRSGKWMSSKMRLMRKMLGGDQILIKKQRRKQSFQGQAQANQESNKACNNKLASEIIRVCSNCKTTKTPLWRSGPQGPKVRQHIRRLIRIFLVHEIQ